MKTKRTSAKRSISLRKRSKPKTTPLGESILRGLEELVAWRRGEIQLRTRQFRFPSDVDVKAVRERAGLSQSEFAFIYCFNPRTLQEWEQGRAKPDTAVMAYLTVIAKNPECVQAALNEA